MKIEGYIMLAVAAFFGAVLALYWFTSYEDAGALMLLATAALGSLIGGYLYWWSRRMVPRPEDRPDANMADGAGNVGSFPDTSIWPFTLGIGLAGVGLGWVFGAWLAVMGGGMVLAAFVGVIVESRRGGVV